MKIIKYTLITLVTLIIIGAFVGELPIDSELQTASGQAKDPLKHPDIARLLAQRKQQKAAHGLSNKIEQWETPYFDRIDALQAQYEKRLGKLVTSRIPQKDFPRIIGEWRSDFIDRVSAQLRDMIDYERELINLHAGKANPAESLQTFYGRQGIKTF